ncbi:MAG: Orotate phosphoribosyltransferase [Parcubacteria group bacterium GW2011_GWA1_33_6]|uniref:Phosphoribosyltransferase domain-containing protein n=1 Tax=Candidatus Staskawiczbacteria bacterium RIFCSPHIGHO2_02_FULL_33_16 TaxID=1802204 RepID=A0A1G2HSA9_9BACT|nr:MAG: Orotate phosphoribosyltransferase [Parcubacteria group bacterium GW2011_GWA2_33_14]KKP55279.1 MAG: Orotate phosphoribosyltransferase [Parcubacteria group bacterium GW2011_GWA1_33_6]OGZ65315.1 MAG: hypothetical protein A3D34_01835 [Candidatus Staskawiczbacteria bacterium RIFCSPHIGHO2_02_FULL_33_16]OGZ69940.1 MAG: hypothetical protein A2980_00425 [Candidatus Staskawiczbacteria bacterium RIFCSPLOWO2_01_FULL_33_13]
MDNERRSNFLESGQELIVEGDPLETLRKCGGYYACPKDFNGKRLGALVGYAGKYKDIDGQEKNYVGDVYFNFAMADEYPSVLKHFSEAIKDNLTKQLGEIDILCGAPIGGYSFSTMLGLVLEKQTIKAEKKITAVATPNSREQSQLVFARHNIKSGVKYAIVEDVCNNFSTTEELIKLINSKGGNVTTIICLLNRSEKVDSQYHTTQSLNNTPVVCDVPVVSLVRQVIQEYLQDDPAVVEDIANGNVVWKPKDDWKRLMDATQTS